MSLSVEVRGQYKNNKTEMIGIHHGTHTPWEDVDRMELSYKLHKYIFSKLDKFKHIDIKYYISGEPGLIENSKTKRIVVGNNTVNEVTVTLDNLLNSMNKMITQGR